MGEMEKTIKNQRKPPPRPDGPHGRTDGRWALPAFSTPLRVSRMVRGGQRGEREGGGRGKGPRREQGQFCFSSRDLTKLGGGKVCVGLGMKPPMMMRSDQEIPFPLDIRVPETRRPV